MYLLKYGNKREYNSSLFLIILSIRALTTGSLLNLFCDNPYTNPDIDMVCLVSPE